MTTNVSLHLASTPILMQDAPEESSAEKLIAKTEHDWLQKANGLAPDKQKMYRDHVGRMVRDLENQVKNLRTFCQDSAAIRQQIAQTLSQYEASLNALYSSHMTYQCDKANHLAQCDSLADKFRSCALSFGVYKMPPPSENPSPWNHLNTLAQYQTMETMAGVHLVGEALHLTGEVIVEGAKAACRLTETTEKGCKVAADYAKKIVQVVADKLPNFDGSSLANGLENDYGFPKDQAEQMAKQFVQDSKSIAIGGAAGGATALAFKGAKTLLGKVATTPQGNFATTAAEVECALPSVTTESSTTTNVFSNRIQNTLFPRPSEGFEAYVQAENKLYQKLAEPYRHFKSNANFHPQVTYAEVPRHPDVYFHATSLKGAHGILQSGSLQRLDKSSYVGAFVSSQPETFFGDVVFAFNRTIENSSKVLNAHFEGGRQWAGFSQSIPVTIESLEYIAVNAEFLGQGPIENVAKQLSATAGREIPVVPLEPIIEKIRKRALEEGTFVPDGWPTGMIVRNK